MWPESPLRDTGCCDRPLTGVPYLRIGPRRADGRAVEVVQGVEIGARKPKPADTTSEPELDSPDGGSPLARTFTSDVYSKMLNNPRLSPGQRAKLEAMQGR